MKLQSVFAFLLFLSSSVSIKATEISEEPHDITISTEKNYADDAIPQITFSMYPPEFPEEFCQFVLKIAPQEIKDLVTLLNNPFAPREIKPKRILLYGPSGSGKTTLAQVIAILLQMPYKLINAGLLGNEFVNSTAANLQRAIEPYLNGLPTVIIIDEIDCILKQPKNEKDPEHRTPKQIWETLDVCASYDNIIVIGITNDISGMPEALQTRFAGDLFEVPLLNSVEQRKKIIKFYLRNVRHSCTDHYVNMLAKRTKHFSTRELQKLVFLARSVPFRKVESFPDTVTPKEFEIAFKQMEKNRSLLKQWSWSDYEKPLQYGLQVAGILVNVASIICSWNSSKAALALQAFGIAQNQAIADRADMRTVENFKFQKMALVAPHYWEESWKPRAGWSDNEWPNFQEKGSYELFLEGFIELKKYYKNSTKK